MLNNGRKNPKVAAKALETAKMLFALKGLEPNSQQREGLADLLFRLWNIDGIELDKEALTLLAHNQYETTYIKQLVKHSEVDGSGYMQQIVNFLNNI